MKAPKLLPRLFRIEHEYNEHFYFIKYLCLGVDLWKWVIVMGPSDYNTFMYGPDNFVGTYWDIPVTATFDSPEEAFEMWQLWMEDRKKAEEARKKDNIFILPDLELTREQMEEIIDDPLVIELFKDLFRNVRDDDGGSEAIDEASTRRTAAGECNVVVAG